MDSGASLWDSLCPPERNRALWSCTKPQDYGKGAWPLMLPYVRSQSWTLIRSLTQPKSCTPISHQDSWPQSQQIRTAILVGPNPNPTLVFLLLKRSTQGTPELYYRTPPPTENEIILFGAVQIPQQEVPLRSQESMHTFFSPGGHKIYSVLSEHLTLALTSESGDLASASAHRGSMPYNLTRK